MATGEERRLVLARRMIAEIRDRLSLEPAFELWDGSTVPANAPIGALRLFIADEGVVASLLRAPRLTTIIRLYAEGRLGVAGGSLFDLAEARPRGKLGRMVKSLDRLLVARTALAFLARPARPAGALPPVQPVAIDGHDLPSAFFETFLDAGTIPFLRSHPELEGALMRELEERISRDERAHIALNWILMRSEARSASFRRGMRFLGNLLVY